MKSALILFFIALLGSRALADIAPDNSGAVLFKVCTMTPTSVRTGDPAQGSKPTFIIDSKNPLLKVVTLNDLRLEQDALGVCVILNQNDAQVMAKLTRQYPLLAFVSGDEKITVLIKVSRPVDDGSILFANAHYTGAMAVYLRNRFHIKPNSNESEVPSVQVSQPVTNSPTVAAPTPQ